MRDYISKYFQEKNLEFKEAGEHQFLLKVCPFCGDDGYTHFYMSSESGLWDCKKCGNRGNFNQFRQAFGDVDIDLSKWQGKETTPIKKEYKVLKYDIPLQLASRLWSIDTKFQEYLMTKRKLTKEILEQFKIGSTGKEISIPIYEDGKLVNIKYRRDPDLDGEATSGARYIQEKGCKPALFNGDILKEPIKQVIITEGEFDALQLIQRGLKNVVSVTLGAGYFSPEWVSKFSDIQQIYYCFDTDDEGRSGVKKAAEKLGFEKCKSILLPKKDGRKKTDITNYFVDDGYTKADFLDLMRKAKTVRSEEGENILPISDFNETLRKLLLEGEHYGIPTGYSKLDEIVGGLRKGRLIVISGDTSVGKSSLSCNIGLNLAVMKYPVFYFSLEMPPLDIAKKILMLKAKLSGDDLKEIKDPSEILERIDKTLLEFKGEKPGDGLPLYLYNGSGYVKLKVLIECGRIAKEEYNCQAIIVDHLQYFVEGKIDRTSETAYLVRGIKLLARELDLPIILLSHVHRHDKVKKGKGIYIPSLSDLKDTSGTEQDADQVIFVCRNNENEDKVEREKAIIKVAKNRDGRVGASISMVFNENIGTFIERIDDVNYEAEVKKEKEELDSEISLDNIAF
jgi:replicative DNA helicase/ribosomal protein L37AE/L43A